MLSYMKENMQSLSGKEVPSVKPCPPFLFFACCMFLWRSNGLVTFLLPLPCICDSIQLTALISRILAFAFIFSLLFRLLVLSFLLSLSPFLFSVTILFYFLFAFSYPHPFHSTLRLFFIFSLTFFPLHFSCPCCLPPLPFDLSRVTSWIRFHSAKLRASVSPRRRINITQQCTWAFKLFTASSSHLEEVFPGKMSQ